MTHLIIEHQHNRVYITLNRANKNNALNSEVIKELKSCFTSLAENPDIHTVILKGAGKHFCAGADLNWMRDTSTLSIDENKREAQHLADMLEQFYHLPQTTICCAHGAVMGGGIGLVACADLVVADAATEFCFSEVKIGLIPATISPYIINAIGPKHAKRYFITAEKFNAERAHHIGLISHSTSDVEQTLNDILSTLEKNGPLARKYAKKLVLSLMQTDLDTAQILADVRASDEAKEGLTAFFETRQPNWIS